MKRNKYIIGGLAVVMLLGSISSCKNGFEDINTDPINYYSTTPDKLLAPALVNTLTAGMMRNRNFNNELMQVTAVISDGDATVFRYEFRRTFSDYLWNAWFVQLTNFRNVHRLASKPGAENKSYQAISLICQAWTYTMLSDVYGDIPYTEANQATSGLFDGDFNSENANFEPKFDRQKDIYLDLFKKLEEANTLLVGAQNVIPSSDPVYKGDVAKWKKFCNSLYLRLLLRISGKADVSTQCIDKIKQIVDNPTTYPVFTGNADNATIRWTGGQGNDPLTNPYFAGVRAQDFRAPSLASFFIDNLANWSDPRISNATNYASGGMNAFGITQGPSGFSGVPSGYAIGAGFERQAYFASYDWTTTAANQNRSLQQSPLTGILMNYAELQFILAEAAAKNWITAGTTKSYYDKGIAASINYWVPNFSADPSVAAFTTYVNGADIAWDDAQNLDGKMEQIHLQKYYAMFLVDLQQWFEYRRTGHPVLPKGPGMRNNGVMPARMTYPVYVQSANSTNYKLAVAAQGPDEIYTNVWWQKP